MKKLFLAFLGVICFAHLVYAESTKYRLNLIDLSGNHAQNIYWDYELSAEDWSNMSIRNAFAKEVENAGYADAWTFDVTNCGFADKGNKEIWLRFDEETCKNSWGYSQLFVNRGSCEQWILDNGMDSNYAKCDVMASCSTWDSAAPWGYSCSNYQQKCSGKSGKCNGYISRQLICKAPYVFDGLVDSNGNRQPWRDGAVNKDTATFKCVLPYTVVGKDASSNEEFDVTGSEHGRFFGDSSPKTSGKLSEVAQSFSDRGRIDSCTADVDNAKVVCTAKKDYFWTNARCEAYRKANNLFTKKCRDLRTRPDGSPNYGSPSSYYTNVLVPGASFILEDVTNSVKSCATGLSKMGTIGCEKK